MAKKKKKAARPAPKRKRILFLISDLERELLGVICQFTGQQMTAAALRLAIHNQARACRAGECNPPAPPETSKTGTVGRPSHSAAVGPYMLVAFPGDAEAIEAIQKAHDLNKSDAIRHAIAEEAKRCQLPRKKSR